MPMRDESSVFTRARIYI